MAGYDFRAQRLFVDAPLHDGELVTLGREQAHYVLNVLRLDEKAPVLVFNGRDGEWLAGLVRSGKRDAGLRLERRIRDQTPPGDVHYLFAPLKQARLDYIVQKAVEMGASAIRPVLTRHTQVSRINRERIVANVIEAAEQCGILSVPAVEGEVRLDVLLDGWDSRRLMVFCDEDAEVGDPIEALRAAGPGPVPRFDHRSGGRVFARGKRAAAAPAADPSAVARPEILRADTAAVAALALVQAVRGDWRG